MNTNFEFAHGAKNAFIILEFEFVSQAALACFLFLSLFLSSNELVQKKRVCIFVEELGCSVCISVEPNWRMEELLLWSARYHGIKYNKGSHVTLKRNHARVTDIDDLRDDDDLTYVNVGTCV